MVILGRYEDYSFSISSKINCLTVSLTNSRGSEVICYDLEGRLWTAMRAGISYRRGLDGKIVAKWIGTDTQRSRRWLTKAEGDDLIETARQRISWLIQAIQQKVAEISQPIDGPVMQAFLQALKFDAVHSRQDIAAYHQVYKPVGILPPDQYMAVVLQLTEGCSFNTCTFCTFYRDRPFRIKSPGEFRNHINEVKEFLGKGLSLRRTIFLADANALVVPTTRLLPLLEVVNQEMDVEAAGGIFAFLDGFSGERKTINDYAQLANKGLRRVYIGMESGNPELLKFIKKPGSPEDVIQAVKNIKAGGVSVGLIILSGAGGKRFSGQHVKDTVRAINSMPLDMDDLIYFSELVESEGMQYVQDAYQANLQPLTPDERIFQGEEIEKSLVFSSSGGTPHISRYDIREFVY